MIDKKNKDEIKRQLAYLIMYLDGEYETGNTITRLEVCLEYAKSKVKLCSLGDVIGCAFINCKMEDVTVIDESRLEKEGIVRVMWKDIKGRRVTSFVKPNEVKKYNL